MTFCFGSHFGSHLGFLRMLKGESFTPPLERLIRPHRQIIKREKNFNWNFWVLPLHCRTTTGICAMLNKFLRIFSDDWLKKFNFCTRSKKLSGVFKNLWKPWELSLWLFNTTFTQMDVMKWTCRSGFDLEGN